MMPKRKPVPKKKARRPVRKARRRRGPPPAPKPKGHQILEAQRVNLRGETVDTNGVMPKRGMWLVHPEKKRVYGCVLRVRRTGEVLVVTDGWATSHEGRMIYEGGYEYHEEMPEGPEWRYHVMLHWVESPPEDWGVLRVKERNSGQKTEGAVVS